jgi:hypothetical protein
VPNVLWRRLLLVLAFSLAIASELAAPARAASPGRARSEDDPWSEFATQVATQVAAQDDGVAQSDAGDSEITYETGPEEVQPAAPMYDAVPGPVADPNSWNEEDCWPQEYEPPAPTCSSGTWFNRGNWYARQDFVYMARNSTDVVRLIDDYSLTTPAPASLPIDRVATPKSLGFEPGGRLTLGGFLFRDGKNRDHALEFVFFGLFDWAQSGGMTSRETDQLFTPVDPFVHTTSEVGGFNQAEVQSFHYNSSFDSYELNYVIHQRLGRDRLEMTPQGEWVRRQSSGQVQSFYTGLRVISIGEGFNWNSVGSNPATRNGQYSVTTNNSLVGAQFGYDLFVRRTKFDFGVRNSIGSFINYADQHSVVSIVDPGIDAIVPANRDETASSHDVSFMYNLSVVGAYHIRPNLSLRASYEFMFLTQIALAPEQLTFTPSVPPQIVNGGTLLFNGTSIGLEMVW